MSRTAENSAKHLLPYIKPGQKILDIGCGPGTITSSFAALVGPHGSVIGVDASEDVIAQASDKFDEVSNVSFEAADASHLRFPAGSFDVVHAHQVLQHVTTENAIAILKEMHRVVKKPGGVISLREGDITSTTMWPHNDLYSSFLDVYLRTTRAAGANPQFAQTMHVTLRQAGFKKEDVTIGGSGLIYGAGNDEQAKWWGDSWCGRCQQSGLAQNAIEGGHASPEQMESFAKMWSDWGRSQDAWWAMLNTEIIIQVSE